MVWNLQRVSCVRLVSTSLRLQNHGWANDGKLNGKFFGIWEAIPAIWPDLLNIKRTDLSPFKIYLFPLFAWEQFFSWAQPFALASCSFLGNETKAFESNGFTPCI